MSARARRRGLVAILVASTATLAGGALAQPVDPGEADIHRAKAMFARGEAAERAGRWAEAIEALREVARIKSTSGVVFHIANCEEHLGQLAEALADFELAEQLAGEASARDVQRLVKPRLAALEKRVPRLTLEIDPADADAEVLVDGASVPRSRWGSALRVSPGEREVVARAGEHDAFRTTVRLAEGDATRVRVELAAALAQTAPKPANATRLTPATEAAPERARAKAPQPAPGRSGPPTVTLVLGGVALALVGAGIGTYVAAGAKNDAAREACASTPSCDPSAREAVRALDATSLALWIGAGAAAATGAVLWGTAKPVSATRAVSARLELGPARVGVGGRF